MKFRMHPNTRIQDKSLSNVSNWPPAHGALPAGHRTSVASSS